MASKEYLQKLREERQAKENARIQKLRELNLKKYGQMDASKSATNATATQPLRAKSTTSTLANNTANCKPNKNCIKPFNSCSMKGGSKTKTDLQHQNFLQTQNNEIKNQNPALIEKEKAANKSNKSLAKLNLPGTSQFNKEAKTIGNRNTANNFKLRKSMSVPAGPRPYIESTSRQSFIPKTSAVQNTRESVFDRLYKPKIIQKPAVDDARKLKNDPNYLKKVSASNLITNRRQTDFEPKSTKRPLRRSISAVHLKKINVSELKNCIHKWASIGEKIDTACLKEISEDENTQEDKLVSAVRSERKKVKFQTPINNPEEMLSKLNKWLHLRGKSIDAYPHLKCFGVLHNNFNDIPKFEYDDENKENIALEHDSDNESFTELNCKGKMSDLNKWRSPSFVDSVDCNESYQTPRTSESTPRENDLLLGALNHLTELLRNGYNREECARWLRAIRDRYYKAQETAAYWECRAALEETRGDLPAFMQCWEQAIAKGTERSAAEASLDQLLDKFMQLKINPSSGKKHVDPKLVDAKNIFRSTLIRFAIQNNNLSDNTKATVTPVRRSTRLSSYQQQTPLKLFTTIQQAIEAENAEFRPNKAIAGTP